MRSLFSISLVLSLSVLGCRSGGTDDMDPDDVVNPDDGDTIYQVQSDDMAVGTPVTLRGVVVVAIDTFGSRTGSIHVMEPEGGAYSGVLVFLRDATAASLKVGDLVDVVGGVKDEFALSEDETGRTLTEISPPQNGATTVTKVGEGVVPAPQVVLPQDLMASDEEAEKWEGVLIKFENVRALSAPRGVTSSDETLEEMRVTGPYFVQSALTAFPEIVRDDCLAEVVGMGDYFFDYKLLPRSAADIVGGGSGCLALEMDEASCTDGEDNDFSGHKDCGDFNCQSAVAGCTAEATVVDIQSGTIEENSRVRLSGVVVTAVGQREFWVQDAGGAALSNGLDLFFGDALPEDITVGATIDVDGTTMEFDGQLTELGNLDITSVTPGDSAVALTGADPSVLASIEGGEPYEGVLVTIENVPVVNPALGFGKISCGAADTPLILDDVLAGMPEGLTEGQCLKSITGVMHWNHFDDHRVLFPRTAEDIDTTAGTCE